MKASAKLHDTCRICSSRDLQIFLDLGNMPLVNRYLDDPREAAAEPRFPLQIACCDSCWLSQLTCVVDPAILYHKYAYHSSISQTFRNHCRDMASELITHCGLGASSRVVEIASNDGCLQVEFFARGIKVLGVEPASNLAQEARTRGVEVIDRFWNEATATQVVAAQGPADLIVATNVVAHVDDLRGFLAAVRMALAPGGRFVFEVPYMTTFLTKTEFDTTYHEHLSYFLLTPLQKALADAGMDLVDAQEFPIHGGSIRVHAALAGAGKPTRAVQRMLGTERDCGFLQPDLYRQFSAHVEATRTELNLFLCALRDRGRHIAAYGASAKGNVLLNYCGLGRDTIDFIVDDTPAKQGKFSPGNGIPIVSRDHFTQNPPEYLLLLAWNFSEELMANLPDFKKSGGRFVLPIPALRVL